MKAIKSFNILLTLLMLTQLLTACGDNAQVRAIRKIDSVDGKITTCAIELQAFFPDGNANATVSVNVEGSFYTLKNYQQVAHNLQPSQCKDSYTVEVITNTAGYSCTKENMQIENQSIKNGLIRCSKQSFSISGKVTGIKAEHFSQNSKVYNKLNASEEASWITPQDEFKLENIPFGHLVKLDVSGLDSNYDYHCALIADGQSYSDAISVMKDYDNAELNCVRANVKLKGKLTYAEAAHLPAQSVLDSKTIQVSIAGGMNASFKSANLNQSVLEQEFEVFVPKNLGAYTMSVEEDLASHSCAADGFTPSGSEITEAMEDEVYNFKCSVEMLSIKGLISGLPAGNPIKLASDDSATLVSQPAEEGEVYEIKDIPYGHLYKVQLTDLINFSLPQGYQCNVVNGGDGTIPLTQSLDNVGVNCTSGSGNTYHVKGAVIGLTQGSITIYEVTDQSKKYITQTTTGQAENYTISPYSIPQGEPGYDVQLKLDLSQTNQVCSFSSSNSDELVLDDQTANVEGENIVCGAAPPVTHNFKVTFNGTVAPTDAVTISIKDVNNSNNDVTVDVDAGATYDKSYVHGTDINFSYDLKDGDISQYNCTVTLKEGQNNDIPIITPVDITVEADYEVKITCVASAPTNYSIDLSFLGDVNNPNNSIDYVLSTANSNDTGTLAKGGNPDTFSIASGTSVSLTYTPSAGASGNYSCSAVDANANNAVVGTNFLLTADMDIQISCVSSGPSNYTVTVDFLGDVNNANNSIDYVLNSANSNNGNTLAKADPVDSYSFAAGTNLSLSYQPSAGATGVYSCSAMDGQGNSLGANFTLNADLDIKITCIQTSPGTYDVTVKFLGDLAPVNEIQFDLDPNGPNGWQTLAKNESATYSYAAGTAVTFSFMQPGSSQCTSQCNCIAYDQNMNPVANPSTFTLNENKEIFILCTPANATTYDVKVKFLGNLSPVNEIQFDLNPFGPTGLETLAAGQISQAYNYDAGTQVQFLYLHGNPGPCDCESYELDQNGNKIPVVNGGNFVVNADKTIYVECDDGTSSSMYNFKVQITPDFQLNTGNNILIIDQMNIAGDFHPMPNGNIELPDGDLEHDYGNFNAGSMYKFEFMPHNEPMICTVTDQNGDILADQVKVSNPSNAGNSYGPHTIAGSIDEDTVLTFDCKKLVISSGDYSLSIKMGDFDPASLDLHTTVCIVPTNGQYICKEQNLNSSTPFHLLFDNVAAGTKFVFKYEGYQYTPMLCKVYDEETGIEYLPGDGPGDGGYINKNLVLTFDCDDSNGNSGISLTFKKGNFVAPLMEVDFKVGLFDVPGQNSPPFIASVYGQLSSTNPSQQIYPNANYNNLVPGSKFAFAFGAAGSNFTINNPNAVNGVICTVKDQFGNTYLPYNYNGYVINQSLVLTFDCELPSNPSGGISLTVKAAANFPAGMKVKHQIYLGPNFDPQGEEDMEAGFLRNNYPVSNGMQYGFKLESKDANGVPVFCKVFNENGTQMFAINQVYNINGDNELIFECSYTSTPSNSYTVTLTTDPVSFPNFAWMKYNFGYQSNSGSSVSAVQWTSAQLNAGQTHTYGPFNASAGGSIAIEYIEWFPDYLDQQCFFKDQNGVVYQNLVFHNLNQDKHLVAYCGTSVTPAPTVSGVKVTYIGAQPNSLQGKGVISNNPVNAISTIAQGMLFDFDLGIGESHFEAAQASQFYFVHADTPAGFSCQLAAGSDPVMGQVGSTIKNVIFECN